MLTTIPFSGFYGSVHDDESDYALDQCFQDPETGEPIPEIVQEVFDRIDWKKWHTLYAEAYCESVAHEFKIKMEFESLHSPREYNFSTDRIFATIELEEVRRIFSETNMPRLRELVRELFTSRSGFCSSYDNDIDDWGDIEGWDHNQVGTLIRAYVEQESCRDFDAYEELDLMESDRCNGNYDNWFAEAIPNCNELWERIPGLLKEKA